MPAQAGGRKRTRTDLERGGAPIEADAAAASTEQEEHEAELEALEAELAAVRADTKKLRCLICLHRSACTDALAQSSSTTLQKAMRGVDILVSIENFLIWVMGSSGLGAKQKNQRMGTSGAPEVPPAPRGRCAAAAGARRGARLLRSRFRARLHAVEGAARGTSKPWVKRVPCALWRRHQVQYT
jgi:hypothetical protein